VQTRQIVLTSVLSLALAACGGSDGDGGSGACSASGTGTLAVTVSGLPAGTQARVTVTGGGGAVPVTGTQSLARPGGTHEISAGLVAVADPLVRTAYAGVVSPESACVRDGATTSVTVTYGPVPTSARAWVGADAHSLGFGRASLGATGTVTPAADADTAGSRGATFDVAGNLWVTGATIADPPVQRFSAASLASSGSKTPDRALSIAGVSCVPGTTGLAFDGAGNLWVTVLCAQKVVRLTPQQLAASGTVTPGVEIGGLVAPQGTAFDGAGNLWIADDGLLKRYDAARLGASTSAAADLALRAQVSGNLLGSDALAFDADGNLWVNDFGANAFYRVTPAQLAGSGTPSPVTVSPVVYVPVTALLGAFAFDEGGGLLTSYTSGKFARLGAAQLAASSSPGAPTVPERIFTSTAIPSFAGDVAIYPAPAALPLYHRLP
jgi:hypothetical protein